MLCGKLAVVKEHMDQIAAGGAVQQALAQYAVAHAMC
jgi:hypothetical protein